MPPSPYVVEMAIKFEPFHLAEGFDVFVRRSFLPQLMTASDSSSSIAPSKAPCGPLGIHRFGFQQGLAVFRELADTLQAMDGTAVATPEEFEIDDTYAAQADTMNTCRIMESPWKRTIPPGPSALDSVAAEMPPGAKEQLKGRNSSFPAGYACFFLRNEQL